MRRAEWLEDEDFMRFHNSHPEAVNFIRTSREAEFLLGHHGESQRIDDAASF